jgi:hypothetical protein
MRLIAHRINTFADLYTLPDDCPIEFDLRDSAGQILVTHDPFTTGPLFSEFATLLTGRFCIVNIKSEGIEWRALEILKENGIEDFFFLDCSIPMIHKLTQSGENRIAVRFSEVEPIEGVLPWLKKVKWVWIDCFTKLMVTRKMLELLKVFDVKVCLVSPELQGRPDDIDNYIHSLMEQGLTVDAVCTKVSNFSKWSALLL